MAGTKTDMRIGTTIARIDAIIMRNTRTISLEAAPFRRQGLYGPEEANLSALGGAPVHDPGDPGGRLAHRPPVRTCLQERSDDRPVEGGLHVVQPFERGHRGFCDDDL